MEQNVSLIGFGEAGSTFACAGRWCKRVHVYDLQTETRLERDAMLAAYREAEVVGAAHLADALSQSNLILSLVTADQALLAAAAAADHILPNSLYCDMNSVAPQTKQAAAQLIDAAGGRYLDVAVMAPVNPARLSVPLLLSGSGAQEAAGRLSALGFANLSVVGETVGHASSVKMIRSVMIKGLEALTAECMLAAEAAGVREEVIASLDASEPTGSWAARADYYLDRMLVHGLRRAAEMEEAVKTLQGVGVRAPMTRATVLRQRQIGELALGPAIEGLSEKIARVHAATRRVKLPDKAPLSSRRGADMKLEMRRKTGATNR
ncbi:NAD(P)-dependent oxidoreductase [Sphingopyxis sp.]|uniref:NAD(P)-dependent oxidoreductase n=1 Tax=Sphingopyxis sp. TaxID=1908224 RepID=UPI002D76BF95|nr:DUF1932 domain-containing protein [Sphingopyxis sp.]HET6523110.1 DUF1932 domain-containing protein [Sphingopyxis sp.]